MHTRAPDSLSLLFRISRSPSHATPTRKEATAGRVEQDRIRAILQAITGRLDSLGETHDEAKVGLDEIIRCLTENSDKFARIEPDERRMLYRALSDLIFIDDDQATRRYKQGESLLMLSARVGFEASTVRAHLQ